MTFCYFPSGSRMYPFTHKGLDQSQNWTPVVSLIANLNHLEQFDYFTKDDFTTGLMEAFSRYHPHCKLNLLRRQEVGWSPLYPDATTRSTRKSNFDMQTLQLPGLHTLKTAIPTAITELNGYQQLDEMLPFLLISPGLKHLSLERTIRDRDPALHLLKSTWQRLLDTITPKAVSQLESVTIPSFRFQASILSKLAAAGDLPQLRTLDINCSIYEPDNLVNIAGLLPNLTRLFLGLNTTYLRTSTINSHMEKFMPGILAFHPLEYLSITGLCNVEDLDRIIQRHGLSLKGLALVPCMNRGYPRLNPSHLLEMANRCPNLEELRLHMKRSLGDQAECEMYKALGTFSNLQRLFLSLDFDARPEKSTIGIRHESDDIEALRQTFINAAMDQSLALQIWSMIRKKGSRLKDLRILPFGNQPFFEEELYLLNCFARSYLVTGYNIENPGVPVIEQIGKRAWEVERAMQDCWGNGILAKQHSLSERAMTVLRSIWPQVPVQTFRSDWWDGWTSMPLQPAMSPGELSKA